MMSITGEVELRKPSGIVEAANMKWVNYYKSPASLEQWGLADLRPMILKNSAVAPWGAP